MSKETSAVARYTQQQQQQQQRDGKDCKRKGSIIAYLTAAAKVTVNSTVGPLPPASFGPQLLIVLGAAYLHQEKADAIIKEGIAPNGFASDNASCIQRGVFLGGGGGKGVCYFGPPSMYLSLTELFGPHSGLKN